MYISLSIYIYICNGVATKWGKGNANREAPTALEADITRLSLQSLRSVLEAVQTGKVNRPSRGDVYSSLGE